MKVTKAFQFLAKEIFILLKDVLIALFQMVSFQLNLKWLT